MIGILYSGSVGFPVDSARSLLGLVGTWFSQVILVERMWVSQTSFDQPQMLGLQVKQGDVGGSGTWENSISGKRLNPALGSSEELLSTADASVEPVYTGNILIETSFDVVEGWMWTPANDDEVIVITASADSHIGLKLETAPSQSMDFIVGLTWREIGK